MLLKAPETAGSRVAHTGNQASETIVPSTCVAQERDEGMTDATVGLAGGGGAAGGRGGGLWWLMRHDLRLAVYAGGLLLTVTMAGAVVAWVRGHRGWAAAMAVLVLGVLGAGAAFGWSLNSTLEKIPRIDDSVLSKGQRPEKEPSTALNILLLGSDNPTPQVDKPTVAELLADGSWDPGAYRSDSIIVLHLSADRKHASMVSIPARLLRQDLRRRGQPPRGQQDQRGLLLLRPLRHAAHGGEPRPGCASTTWR